MLISFKRGNAGSYKPAQIAKLSGVVKMDKIVVIPVKLIESAVLPLAKFVRKFETLPPGQAATKNIPKATLGGGCINKTKHQVKKGRRINWEHKPKKIPFGFLTKYLKSAIFNSKAIPNMIKAKARFRNNKSWEEKFKWIASISVALFI
jgi:hypothetical protein